MLEEQDSISVLAAARASEPAAKNARASGAMAASNHNNHHSRVERQAFAVPSDEY